VGSQELKSVTQTILEHAFSALVLGGKSEIGRSAAHGKVKFIHYRYCTTQHNLNVSQIQPFIENEESFRKFCHGGCNWNSILRATTVTDFLIFWKKNIFIVKSHMFFAGHPG
jgi:hypothetical protein